MRLAGSDCAPAWVASRIGGHAKNSVSGSDHRRSHRMAPHVLQTNNFEPAQRDQMSRSITDPATTTSSPANDDAAAALMATGRHVDGSAIAVIPTYRSPIYLRTLCAPMLLGHNPRGCPKVMWRQYPRIGIFFCALRPQLGNRGSRAASVTTVAAGFCTPTGGWPHDADRPPPTDFQQAAST